LASVNYALVATALAASDIPRLPHCSAATDGTESPAA
jgi:hypothetical protein